MRKWTLRLAGGSLIAGAFGGSAAPVAQDRLKTVAAYEQYQKLAAQIPTAIRSGALAVTWSGDSRSFEYTRDGKRYRYDVVSRRTTESCSL